jgi:hypothetical protein
MKNLNTQLVILLATVSMLGIGCSKKSSNSDSSTTVVTGIDGGTAVTPPAGTGGSTGSTVASNTVQFNPVSLLEMNSYVGTHPLNNPTNITLQVNLSNVGNNRYGGTINISYVDNGIQYNGSFKSCFTSNCINPNYSSYGTARDVGVSEANYNYWFSMGGKTVFSGFFQDSYGAIILVIDNISTTNQGDGQGGVSTASGQIWYRNFAQSFAYQSTLRTCWFIYAGPYDCRSGVAMNKSALYPTDSYRKLGSFSGLAFTY